MVFVKSGTSSYQDRVRKPTENKNAKSQRIFLKIYVAFESGSNKRRSRGRKQVEKCKIKYVQTR